MGSPSPGGYPGACVTVCVTAARPPAEGGDSVYIYEIYSKYIHCIKLINNKYNNYLDYLFQIVIKYYY